LPAFATDSEDTADFWVGWFSDSDAGFSTGFPD
jgi:hypothetical protein